VQLDLPMAAVDRSERDGVLARRKGLLEDLLAAA
jgi:hypothetical protein